MNHLAVCLTSLLFAVVIPMLEPPRMSANEHEIRVFIAAFAQGEEGAIHAFRLPLDTGRLQRIHRTSDVEQPFFLAVAPGDRFLYAIHVPGPFAGPDHAQVAAYEVVGSTGELRLLNRQSALGVGACYLDVDATGQALVLANYFSGSVVSFPVRADGSLGEAASFFQLAGSSVDSERQEGPHTHCTVVSPDNRFVLAADLGLDQILVYRLDSDTGQLTPHEPPFVTTPRGAGPRHVTFHPGGRYVYAVNELQNSITRFDYNSADGSLEERATVTTLPGDYDGTSYCADVKITPNGRFLYATNRGHDSIAVYEIGSQGEVALVEIVSSEGSGPQNLAITPGGQWLLCANMPGNSVVVFRIDPDTGRLTRTGESIAMPGPSCIMLLSAGSPAAVK